MFEKQDEHLEATLADLIVALTQEAFDTEQEASTQLRCLCSAEYFKSFGTHLSHLALRKTLTF